MGVGGWGGGGVKRLVGRCERLWWVGMMTLCHGGVRGQVGGWLVDAIIGCVGEGGVGRVDRWSERLGCGVAG